MLKVLKERMNTQIAENYSHIKAKAMRKSQGQMLMTDRSNRDSSKLFTKTTSKKTSLQEEST